MAWLMPPPHCLHKMGAQTPLPDPQRMRPTTRPRSLCIRSDKMPSWLPSSNGDPQSPLLLAHLSSLSWKSHLMREGGHLLRLELGV